MIQLNTPIEVSQKTYNFIMGQMAGTCFGREENGKFYIKPALMTYKDEIEKVIKHFPL